MGDVKYRIGLGTVGGGSLTGKNDVNQPRPVDEQDIMTADAVTRYKADSKFYTADGQKTNP